MCDSCDFKTANKPIKYECQCQSKDCSCGIIEFEKEPRSIPYCCGLTMKRL